MEIWDLYNTNRELIGKTHIRGDELPDDGLHLVVHVWIRNLEGKFLISQRSEQKKSYPLFFECVGGSVLAGETSKQGAIRETLEEVGINLNGVVGEVVFSKTRTIVNGEKFNDIMDVWLFEVNENPDLEKATTKEVVDVKWCTPQEINQIYKSGNLVPTLEYFFEKVQNYELKKVQKNTKNYAKNKKKSKKLSETSRYFDFYDDIKAGCHKIIDW